MDHFKDKVVIITGSSKGIGKSLAEKLARKGAKIVLNGRDEVALARVADTFRAKGYAVTAVSADISRLEDCQKILNASLEAFGQIDYLVNNAGSNMQGRMEDIQPSALPVIMGVNYMGALYLTRLALPELKRQNGGVLFISSVAGIHGLPMYGLYSSAKMALRALAEALRAETAGSGLYVGLAYIGLTQNEQGKTIYDASGGKIPKVDTPGFKLQPIDEVADGLIRMMEKRKFIHIFTFLGKLTALLNRLSPALVQFILTRAHQKRSW